MNDNNSYLNLNEFRTANQGADRNALYTEKKIPYTAQRKARTCESCHANLKTAGLGLGGGTFGTKQYTDIVEDLIDARTGEIIPKKYSVQIPGIPKLKFDWPKIVERDGTQVATVGTHRPIFGFLRLYSN